MFQRLVHVACASAAVMQGRAGQATPVKLPGRLACFLASFSGGYSTHRSFLGQVFSVLQIASGRHVKSYRDTEGCLLVTNQVSIEDCM